MTTRITEIATADIRRSPHNHRKTFTGLDELAASIVSKGIINPITVRPTNSLDLRSPGYELVAGERRWRAAKIAKLKSIPCIVRELTDKEVLEIQVIENVQRADVHPMEEAEGYEELIEKHGYDVDQIAAKTGKSKAYVYARLKLCSLGDRPRAAFLDGRLTASIALLIARIPDLELQERATNDVLGDTVDDPDSRPEEDLEDLEDPDSPLFRGRRSINVPELVPEDGRPWPASTSERIPMSVREAQIHLQRRYMLRLSLAKFDVTDPVLVPSAGACGDCDFRTGNQRDLFADVEHDDICTKPSCFEAKTRASWERAAAEAEDKGIKIVTADEATRVFTPSSQIRNTSPFVDPKSTVPLDLLPAGTTKAPTWEKLLGKRLAEQTPKVLAQDLSGAGHELLDKKKAVEVLREAGKIDKPLKPPTSSSSSSSSSSKGKDPYKEQQAKETKKREQWTRALRASVEEVFAKAKKLDRADPEWWSWVVGLTIDATSTTNLRGDAGDARHLWETARSIEDYMQLLTTILIEEAAQIPSHEGGLVYRDPAKEKDLQAGLAMLGIDYEKHLERIKASDKEAAKAERKLEAAKKPKKGKAK